MIELWDALDKNGKKTGRLQKRGWLESGNYHLVVFVWIINAKGEFLISKRTPNIRWSNKWGCTAGSVIAGENSIQTAIKEVNEELGIRIDPKYGQLFKQYRNDINDNCGEFIDVWLFQQEFNISSVVFQPNETCDAMWANKETIQQMIREGIFFPPQEACPYLNELFYFCDEVLKNRKNTD